MSKEPAKSDGMNVPVQMDDSLTRGIALEVTTNRLITMKALSALP